MITVARDTRVPHAASVSSPTRCTVTFARTFPGEDLPCLICAVVMGNVSNYSVLRLRLTDSPRQACFAIAAHTARRRRSPSPAAFAVPAPRRRFASPSSNRVQRRSTFCNCLLVSGPWDLNSLLVYQPEFLDSNGLNKTYVIHNTDSCGSFL